MPINTGVVLRVVGVESSVNMNKETIFWDIKMKLPPPLPLISGYSVNKKASDIQRAEEAYLKTLTEKERQERQEIQQREKLQVARSAYGFLGTLTLATAATIATGPIALALGAGVAIMAWRTFRNAQKLDKEIQNLSEFNQKVDQRRAAQSQRNLLIAKPALGIAAL